MDAHGITAICMRLCEKVSAVKMMHQGLILQNTVSSITKFPNKRSKSRWEPVAEEKLDSKFAPVNLESSKNVSWAERMAGSRILEGMDNGWTSMKFPLVQQQSTLIKKF
ncbi:hypothetical protein HPP92_015518 [Vanilla planifolia]|nr:hypothetical protein HPP92_015518 [Vanilla planifolia]